MLGQAFLPLITYPAANSDALADNAAAAAKRSAAKSMPSICAQICPSPVTRYRARSSAFPKWCARWKIAATGAATSFSA